MIKCCVTGDVKQIQRVREVLKRLLLKNYKYKVKELIPEAAVYGTSKCTAVFYVNANFLDCSFFSSLSAPAIRMVFEHGREFYKPAGWKRGYWQEPSKQMVEFECNNKAELSEERETLDPFEDLEHWEWRRYEK